MKTLLKMLAVGASVATLPAIAHVSSASAVHHGVEHAGIALGIAVIFGVLVAVAATRR